jgi:hypothetical protein
VSGSAKLAGVLVGVAAACALLAYYIVGYLIVTPPNVQASGQAPHAKVTMQTVASLGFGPHPDWVSYLIKNDKDEWVHSTVLTVPANSVVTVTIYQYDTATGLRNPFWGGPRGIVGLMKVDGKPYATLDPSTLQEAHTTVVFTFHTGKKGTFRWQCFVPCAFGTILGFGGPMQSLGYMDGLLHVV